MPQQIVIDTPASGQSRVTFTSAEVGNGSANDSGMMVNQDGGLAVRIQAEAADGTLTGPVERYTDEDVVFRYAAGSAATFDVRDLVSGVQRGDLFRTATLGTAAGETLTGTSEADYINAGQGEDSVNGAAGSDFLVGGAGNDTLDGGTGADGLLGGGGDDVYLVDNALDRVIEAAGGGTDRVFASTSYTLAAGQEIETLQLLVSTGGFQFDLTGNEFANSLVGNNGNNTLNGGGGADRLTGRGDNDTYIVDNAGDQVFEAAGGGSDRVVAYISYTLAAGQEIEKLGSRSPIGDIDLTGNEFANILSGNEGRNVLDGGAGADDLFGYDGDDTYIVDNAGDRVSEAAGGGTDRVFASTSYALLFGREIEALQLLASTGNQNFNLTGNAFANSLVGNIGDNVLNGGAGADRLTGRDGDDTYIVDNGRDQVVEARGQGNDTVLASTSYTLATGQEIEALQLLVSTGRSNLSLTGNEFANSLVGNIGNNVLNGGAGADRLTGRDGDDTFVFSTALGSGNVDTLVDVAGGDTIRLSASVFTALSAGELDDDAFKDLGTGASLDASDRILYDSRTGALSYDADGSGAGAAVQFATLENRATLSADDFTVA